MKDTCTSFRRLVIWKVRDWSSHERLHNVKQLLPRTVVVYAFILREQTDVCALAITEFVRAGMFGSKNGNVKHNNSRHGLARARNTTTGTPLPLSVRTHTCAVCNVIGQHFENHCPSKHLVGLPEVKRRTLHEQAELTFYESTCHPALVDADVAIDIIRRRGDVPQSLRCFVCTFLCDKAVWCERCDTIACSLCLAPPDCQWVCAKCMTVDETAFHVVGPLRDMCEHWIKLATVQCDAQTIHRPFVSDVEAAANSSANPAPEMPALPKRKRSG